MGTNGPGAWQFLRQRAADEFGLLVRDCRAHAFVTGGGPVRDFC